MTETYKPAFDTEAALRQVLENQAAIMGVLWYAARFTAERGELLKAMVSTRELVQAPADESRVSGVGDLTGIAVRLRESISDGWSGDAAAASADIAEEAAAALIRCRDEITCLRDALAGLVRVFVNPYDGGEFEAGEVPELDAARATLFGQQPKP